MTIETITTADAATKLLAELAETHDWVSVFWDRRDRPTAEISIIVDGNGQEPKALLTADVYKELRDAGTIGKDTLQTFHPRRLHDYKTPPEDEPTGPKPAEVCEKVVRAIVAEHPDWPLQGEFYRGLGDGKRPAVRHEHVGRTARTWVRLATYVDEVSVLAMKYDFLGPEMISEYRAVKYPTVGGDVDLEALAGDEFKAAVIALVEQRMAEIGAVMS